MSKSEKQANKIVYMFQSGLTMTQISRSIGMSTERIRHVLLAFMDESDYRRQLESNKQARKQRIKDMDEKTTEEILTNSRQLVAEIREKFSENKGHELDEEQIRYAKILIDNNFMTNTGEITQEGIEALYQ